MENKKTIQSVHADGSDGEKISATFDPTLVHDCDNQRFRKCIIDESGKCQNCGWQSTESFTNQSLLDETIEIDTPKGIVNFLQKRNGTRFPYLTKHRYSVTDLVHCQRKSLYKQMGINQEELLEDRSIEGMWSTVRGDFLHNMTYAYKWREIDIEYNVPLENGKQAAVIGRLDMYDWKTKTIMDLKSTKNVQWQIKKGFLPKLEHILQVQCYGTMFADYIPIENLNIVYVDNSDIVTYKIQKHDLTDWIKTRIQEIENSVEKKQMLDGEPSGLCQFCRYQTKCHSDGNGIQHTPMSVPKGVEKR